MRWSSVQPGNSKTSNANRIPLKKTERGRPNPGTTQLKGLGLSFFGSCEETCRETERAAAWRLASLTTHNHHWTHSFLMNCLQNNSPVPPQLPWYSVRTKPKHESIAAGALKGKGYEQYLPLYRSRRRWSDRVVDSVVPQFPGYVFCRFDANRRLPILTTPGVISIVSFGKGPTPIEESQIEAIQLVLSSGLAVEPCPFLREGQCIRVNRGSLEGLEGFLLKKKSEWRMVVSITMLQRSVSVEIDREWVSEV